MLLIARTQATGNRDSLGSSSAPKRLAKRETWKPIPGFEGLYSVSSKGRVKSLPRRVPHGQCVSVKVKGKIKVAFDFRGYLRLNLYKSNKAHPYFVHQLVMLAFVGPCPEGMEVHHGPDHDTHNNCFDNLKYLTKEENRREAYLRHGGGREPGQDDLEVTRFDPGIDDDPKLTGETPF